MADSLLDMIYIGFGITFSYIGHKNETNDSFTDSQL